MKEREFIFLSERGITYANIENLFTNEKYYNAMKGLSNTEKFVLFMTVVEERKAWEIARMMNTTQENVLQIKSRAVKDFKKNLRWKCKGCRF